MADAGDRAAQISERAVGLLGAELAALPAGAERQQRYALEYSLGRYKLGIPHYLGALEKIGFAGADRALDVGSGAGHWCVALALLNPSVTGIEPNAEFVELARRVADAVDLGDVIEYLTADGETASFAAGSFDLALCHSVMMYAHDPERLIRNIGGWLRSGGRLYCAYTGLGMRLAAVSRAIADENPEQLSHPIRLVMAQLAYRCGLYHTPGSQVRMATPDELLRLLEGVGFGVVDRPGIQDGAAEFRGVVGTYDFLLEKQDDEPMKRELLERARADVHAAAPILRDAVGRGMPGIVLEVLGEFPASENDPLLRDVRVRALVKAGRSSEVDLGEHEGLDPSTRALLELDRRDWVAAADTLRDSACADADSRFLHGFCLLELGRLDEAERIFLDLDDDLYRSAAGCLAVSLARDDAEAIMARAEAFLARAEVDCR